MGFGWLVAEMVCAAGMIQELQREDSVGAATQEESYRETADAHWGTVKNAITSAANSVVRAEASNKSLGLGLGLGLGLRHPISRYSSDSGIGDNPRH